jgi:hypothetical protein
MQRHVNTGGDAGAARDAHGIRPQHAAHAVVGIICMLPPAVIGSRV